MADGRYILYCIGVALLMRVIDTRYNAPQDDVGVLSDDMLENYTHRYRNVLDRYKGRMANTDLEQLAADFWGLISQNQYDACQNKSFVSEETDNVTRAGVCAVHLYTITSWPVNGALRELGVAIGKYHDGYEMIYQDNGGTSITHSDNDYNLILTQAELMQDYLFYVLTERVSRRVYRRERPWNGSEEAYDRVGKRFLYTSFTSTSWNDPPPSYGPNTYEIEQTYGQNITNITQNPTDKEILIPMGPLFNITYIHRNESVTDIHLEEIDRDTLSDAGCIPRWPRILVGSAILIPVVRTVI